MIYLVLLLIVIILYFYINRKRAAYYYINSTNQEFKNITRNIIKSSPINKKFPIYEVNNKPDANIVIHLTPRIDMIKKYDSGSETNTDGSKLFLSYTVNLSPLEIHIDEDNWLYGVPKSGLSLDNYRTYIIQHEFMHALGFDHQECNSETATNGVCPLMYQATRGPPEGFKAGYQVTPIDYTKYLSYGVFS